MDLETFLFCLAAYLAIGCNITWGAVKDYAITNKRPLRLREVFILNLIVMFTWPIVFVWAVISRR